MASISSLSGSSSSSSIYGSRNYNIISGLASGLDTEEMISGVVQSYQQKIQSLQQNRTKLEWQQEAYQSISDKLVEFARNYTSFAYSSTNLASASFFNNAVITTTGGSNAALVSATGKSSSSIIIDAVNRLATTARYAVTSNGLDKSITADGGQITATGDKTVDLAGDVELSKLAGSLTLTYGSRTLSLNFGERELFGKDGGLDAEGLQAAIEEKLKQQQITTNSGSKAADTLIGVTVDDNGAVSFYDKSGANNKISISGATGSLAETIDGLEGVIAGKESGFNLDLTGGVVESVKTADYLAGKSITVSLDGKSKTIQLPTVSKDSADPMNDFITALNQSLKDSFGTTTSADGVEVNRVSVSSRDGKLAFTVDDGSTLSVTASSSDVGDVLGVGKGLTSYLNTSKTLGELDLGWKWDDASTGELVKGTGAITAIKDEEGNITGYRDSAGNDVDENGNRLGKDGKLLYAYDLKINGVTIGSYTRDTEFNTVINDINANTQAGVNVNYSKTTGQFVFTAKDTGAGGRIEISGGLGEAIFGEIDPDKTAGYEKGQDAQLSVTINGKSMELTRSSNTFDLDGMSVTLNGTFTATNDSEKVTFTSKADTDTIVDAVKKMVEDFNEIIKEVKSAYSDMPLQQSDGSRYDPLTDEDMADMSESAIESYEEKAKTGILFMDSDLSSLYNSLRNAISASGADGATLRSIGIKTDYSDGLTTLTLDEQALRDALESDPDKVQQAFTKSKDSGAATDGLMASIKSITERYASTTGEPKGILIEKAGSKYSPSAALDNTLLDQMQDIDDQIKTWQDKMSNKVDYYTNKFTQLELLINQMNSQSSTLAGLMGG